MYVPLGDMAWLANFIQSGRGLGSYSGNRFQRGYGLGSMFRSMLQSLLPVAKNIGKQALRAGAEVTGDYLQGDNIKSSIRKRARQGTRRLLTKGAKAILDKQTGDGLAVRPRKSTAKSIKRVVKRKTPVIPKRKPYKRSDAFGLY